MRRVDWRELSRRAGLPFAAFVLLTWTLAWKKGAERPVPDLYPFLKRAFAGASFVARPGGRAFDVRRDGRIVGQATTGSASGYAGPLTLAVATGPDGRLASVALLEYRDTPDLMARSERLLRSLLGKAPGDAFEVGGDVDGVTGATLSSRGIAAAAREASHRLAGSRAGPAEGAGMRVGAPEIALVLLLAAGAAGRHRPGLAPRTRKALHASTALASLATIGFLWNRPFTIGFPTRLLAGDWPPWTTHLYWYVLLGGVLLAFARSGKSPYCPWICPFGAAQDAIGLVASGRQRRIPSALLFSWAKRALLWLAVLLGLLYRAPGAASYEVFAAFFRLTGTPFQLVTLGVVLLAAAFVRRPYCGWLCPVDSAEQAARVVRIAALRAFGKRAAWPRVRRPVLLAVEPARRAPIPVFLRLRRALLTAAGLFCALLALAHLHHRFSSLGQEAQEGLMSRTFVSSTGR